MKEFLTVVYGYSSLFMMKSLKNRVARILSEAPEAKTKSSFNPTKKENNNIGLIRKIYGAQNSLIKVKAKEGKGGC